MRALAKICVCMALVVIAAGCSEHPKPPVERMELVSRFFRSVRNGEFDAAAQQGRKLYTLDRNNTFLLHLVTIHESNVFLRRAQKALNSGDVEGSLRILAEGRKRYPDNRTLGIYYSKVTQLRNAKKLIKAMENARSSAAMSASLTAATTGLGANMTPRLAAYFKQYEKRIAEVAARERREAEKAESLLPPPQSVVKPPVPEPVLTPRSGAVSPTAADKPSSPPRDTPVRPLLPEPTL